MSKKSLLIMIMLTAVLIAVVFLLWPRAAAESSSGFGDCLVERGVYMYGSDNCASCSDQKRVLGEEFNKISYINCDFNKEECTKKGISVYPVWAKGNNVLLGLQSLETLSEFSGCGL